MLETFVGFKCFILYCRCLLYTPLFVLFITAADLLSNYFSILEYCAAILRPR